MSIHELLSQALKCIVFNMSNNIHLFCNKTLLNCSFFTRIIRNFAEVIKLYYRCHDSLINHVTYKWLIYKIRRLPLISVGTQIISTVVLINVLHSNYNYYIDPYNLINCL